MFKRISHLRNPFLLSSLVFILSQLVLLVVCNQIENVNYWDPASFSRWDSGWYREIYSNGYWIDYCNGDFGRVLREKYFCGSAGWFPAYPYLIKALSFINDDFVLLGSISSKVLHLFNLFLISLILKIDKFSIKNFYILLAASLFWGAIYYSTIFPMSLLLFIILLGIYALLNERNILLLICCFLASFAYSTGFLFTAAIAFYYLIRTNGSLINKAKKSTPYIISGILGILAFFLILEISTSHWNAFILAQAAYGHGMSNPLPKFIQPFKLLINEPFKPDSYIHLQSALVIITMLLLNIFFYVKRLYKQNLLLLSYLLLMVFFFFPWIIGSNQLSLYRAESLLLPMVFFLPQMKRFAIEMIVLVLLLVHFSMSSLFFSNVLI